MSQTDIAPIKINAITVSQAVTDCKLYLSRNDLVTITGLTKSQIKYATIYAIDHGFIVRVGTTRGAVYCLPSNSHETAEALKIESKKRLAERRLRSKNENYAAKDKTVEGWKAAAVKIKALLSSRDKPMTQAEIVEALDINVYTFRFSRQFWDGVKAKHRKGQCNVFQLEITPEQLEKQCHHKPIIPAVHTDTRRVGINKQYWFKQETLSAQSLSH